MADTRKSKSQILTYEQFKADEMKRDPFFGHDDNRVRARFNQYLNQGLVASDRIAPSIPGQNVEEEDPELQRQRRRQGTIVTGFRSDTGTLVTGMKTGSGSRLGQ